MNPLEIQDYDIYKLVDPRDRLPHYVGLTTDIQRRFDEHMRGDNRCNKEKDAWIDELIAIEMMPLVEIAEHIRCIYAEAVEREAYWIRRLRSEGMPLTNQTYRDRIQLTFALDKKMKRTLQALKVLEGRDISDIVCDALDMYYGRSPHKSVVPMLLAAQDGKLPRG
jgi:predicted GIY-YIG superfamily endonuclease